MNAMWEKKSAVNGESSSTQVTTERNRLGMSETYVKECDERMKSNDANETKPNMQTLTMDEKTTLRPSGKGREGSRR